MTGSISQPLKGFPSPWETLMGWMRSEERQEGGPGCHQQHLRQSFPPAKLQINWESIRVCCMGDKLKAKTFVLAVARRQSCEQAIFHAHLSSQRKTSLPGESAGRGHVPTTPTVLLSSHGEWARVGTSSPREVTSNQQWNPGRVTAEIGDK